jgi:hypothetical protein
VRVLSLQGLPWLLVVGRRRLLQGVQLLLRKRVFITV